MNDKKHLFVDFDKKKVIDLTDCKGPECNKCNKFSKEEIRDLAAQKKIEEAIKDLPQGEKVAVIFSVADELLQNEHPHTQMSMIGLLASRLELM